jgi:pre-mRNA cleavage complex 2 protein Pcf11
MWIVAPTESEKTNEPCPICKEKFVSEWSEDEEEWIWKNARKVDEEIYHGSCYYSARVLSTNVANRGTTGTPGARASTERRRSRTATPDVDLNRSAAPSANPLDRLKGEEGALGGHAASKKRKEGPSAGDDAAAAAGQGRVEGGEPEGKRVALESEA